MLSGPFAYDHVEAGKVPEKWNMPFVWSFAALLVVCDSSFPFVYMSLYTSHEGSIHVHRLSSCLISSHLKLSFIPIQCSLGAQGFYVCNACG